MVGIVTTTFSHTITTSSGMDSKDLVTIVIAIVVAVATFVIGYSQMKIASAKTKLDLYNKRFAVYEAALEYYQAVWGETIIEDIDLKDVAFLKALKESRYLFDLKDGIYMLMDRIYNNVKAIYQIKIHEESTEEPIDRSHIVRRNRIEMSSNVKELEFKLEKYLQFKAVSGWNIHN